MDGYYLVDIVLLVDEVTSQQSGIIMTSPEKYSLIYRSLIHLSGLKESRSIVS
jgi:hypothetical protein